MYLYIRFDSSKIPNVIDIYIYSFMYSFHFTGFGEPGKLAMINNSIESLKYHFKKKFQRVSHSKLK